MSRKMARVAFNAKQRWGGAKHHSEKRFCPFSTLAAPSPFSSAVLLVKTNMRENVWFLERTAGENWEPILRTHVSQDVLVFLVSASGVTKATGNTKESSVFTNQSPAQLNKGFLKDRHRPKSPFPSQLAFSG